MHMGGIMTRRIDKGELMEEEINLRITVRGSQPDIQEQCPDCFGRGFVPTETDITDCPRCGGSQFIKSTTDFFNMLTGRTRCTKENM